VARLDGVERPVLLDLTDAVLGLLQPDGPPEEPLPGVTVAEVAPCELAAPDDPAVRRLLPDASPDRELAAELRRLTEPELRLGKAARLRTWRAAVEAAEPELVLAEADGPGTAAALTDLRLVLATWLGLETDDDAEDLHRLAADRSEPADEAEESRRLLAQLYELLSVLQESLVGQLAAGLRDVPHPGRDASGADGGPA
jgi:hypothetical protein